MPIGMENMKRLPLRLRLVEPNMVSTRIHVIQASIRNPCQGWTSGPRVVAARDSRNVSGVTLDTKFECKLSARALGAVNLFLDTYLYIYKHRV